VEVGGESSDPTGTDLLTVSGGGGCVRSLAPSRAAKDLVARERPTGSRALVGKENRGGGAWLAALAGGTTGGVSLWTVGGEIVPEDGRDTRAMDCGTGPRAEVCLCFTTAAVPTTPAAVKEQMSMIFVALLAAPSAPAANGLAGGGGTGGNTR
jgi:hypothetical protein